VFAADALSQDVSVRYQGPQALPPPSATPAEVREFVLHVLWSETHDLVGDCRDDIVRVNRHWDRGGEFLRTASLLEFRIAARSVICGYALFVEAQRLLEAEAKSQVSILFSRSRLVN
jgi:hypothetical protein